jgi:hypothetical protein
MLSLTSSYNRLTDVIEDDNDASDALNLLMNSFEMYHEMVLALITKESGHVDPRTLRARTDGIDGLADSLRARAILIDAYLAPGDHLTTSR